MRFGSKLVASSIAAALLSSTLLAGKHETHWGYTGHSGPQSWGSLSDEYLMCNIGKNQSPINIHEDVKVRSVGLEPIGFDYSTNISSVINNGHTVQVNFDKGSSITIDGIDFSLLQLHFHTPSENQIDGEHFPLEGHFVHAAKDGSLAVVALMFEDGASNPFIAKVWSKMPHLANGKKSINISSKEVVSLLPKDISYYRFSGSLTTPPCSEGVRWLVLKNYTSISKDQVKEFATLFESANNRPIQPINARQVKH